MALLGEAEALRLLRRSPAATPRKPTELLCGNGGGAKDVLRVEVAEAGAAPVPGLRCCGFG